MISAREAMQCAENAGVARDYESARFWLDFARELREEFFARTSYEAVWGKAKPFTPAPPEPDVLAGTDRPRQEPYFGMPSPDPVTRPGEAIEGGGMRCRHCGYFLKCISAESVGRDDSKSFYVHTRTGQQVCPVSAPGGPDDTVVHTFAEPE